MIYLLDYLHGCIRLRRSRQDINGVPDFLHKRERHIFCASSGNGDSDEHKSCGSMR